MDIGLAGIAEYATFVGGAVNVLGFRREVSLEQLNVKIDLSIVAMFYPSPDEYGTTVNLGFRLTDPKGEIMIGPEFITSEFKAPDHQLGISGTNIMMRVVGLPIKEEGRYTVTYLKDNENNVFYEYQFGVVVQGKSI